MVHCLKPAPAGLTPDEHPHRGRRKHHQHRRGLGRAGDDACRRRRRRRRAEAAYFKSLPDAANVLVVGTSDGRRLLAVHAAAGERADAGGGGSVRSHRGARRASIRSWPKSSSRSRSSARPYFDCKPQPPDCPPDLPAPPPINYLAKDYGSFRTVMLDRLQPASAGVEGDQRSRPRHRAGRTDRLRRRPAQLQAGRGRDRSLPADGAQPHLAAPPCAAGRLPRPRRLQRARLDAAAGQRASVVLDARATRFYTFAPGHAAERVAPATRRAALDAGVIVFEPMQDASSFPSTTRCRSTPGATRTAACREAPRRPRCSAPSEPPGRRRADLPGDGGPADRQRGRRRRPPSLRRAADAGRDAGCGRASRWSIRSSRRAPASRSRPPRRRRRRSPRFSGRRTTRCRFPSASRRTFLDSTAARQSAHRRQRGLRQRRARRPRR